MQVLVQVQVQVLVLMQVLMLVQVLVLVLVLVLLRVPKQATIDLLVGPGGRQPDQQSQCCPQRMLRERQQQSGLRCRPHAHVQAQTYTSRQHPPAQNPFVRKREPHPAWNVPTKSDRQTRGAA